MKKLASHITNAKTRTLVIVAGGILVVGIIIALTSSGGAETNERRQSSASGVPTNVVSTPGARTTENYRKLQEEANLRGIQQAERNTSTFIPTVIGSRKNSDFKAKLEEALGNVDKQFEEAAEKANQDSNFRDIANLSAREQLELKNQKQQDDIKRQRRAIQEQRAREERARINAENQKNRAKQFEKIVQAMEQQRNMAMDDWNFVPNQRYKAGEYSAAAIDQQQARAAANGEGNGNSEEDLPIVLKAGQIVYGVIETSVSSDEAGPVLAKVVVPPLKGARLIGEIKPAASPFVEKLQLSFSKINIPNHPTTFGISAVAIDPDTARNAIATDVDHHYLERWGSLFASSFLESYSKAVEEAGATTTIATEQSTGASTTQTNRPELSGKEQLFAGLSKVGENWSEVLKQRVERPVTIYIEQGTGVGILLTDDLRLGAEIATNDTTESSSTSAANQAFQTLIPSYTLLQNENSSSSSNSSAALTTTTTEENS